MSLEQKWQCNLCCKGLPDTNEIEEARTTRDLHVRKVRVEMLVFLAEWGSCQLWKIIKWWVLSMNLKDLPQVNPNADNWYMHSWHSHTPGRYKEGSFRFDLRKWSDLLKVTQGFGSQGVPAGVSVTAALWHPYLHCIALNSFHKHFPCFSTHKWSGVQKLQQFNSGALAFSNAKLPLGVTSALLKEEISLHSIIGSKWFEKALFPTLCLSSKMWWEARVKQKINVPLLDLEVGFCPKVEEAFGMR